VGNDHIQEKILNLSDGKFRVGLAPMEGVTEFPLRVWYALLSAPDFVCTPFLRATHTYPHLKWPLEFSPESFTDKLICSPLLMQMMAKNSGEFIQTLKLVPENTASIDINCGCPAPVVVGKGAGSSILQDPLLFRKNISEICHAIGPHRLGVKMRLGFHDTTLFSELINAIGDLPLARITIHGRTRDQGYKGNADWSLINLATQLTDTPIWGSGDIFDLQTYREKLSLAPKVATVIIGRGALRNPWIFDEIRNNREITVDKRTLIAAFIAFTLLHDLWNRDELRFIEFIEEQFNGIITPLSSSSQWESIICKLEGQYDGHWDQLELSRFAIGRTKMIWNYMRSGLPESFFEPRVLRSKTLQQFIAAISAIWDQELVPFKFNPHHNWIYAGEKNPHKLRTSSL